MKDPTFLEIRQGTDDWKQLRKTRISATDISAILGVSPWCTAIQLWRRKVGFESEQEQTEAMRWGSRMEPTIRSYVENELGLDFPAYVVFHKEHDWRMASLDGFNKSTNTVLEIKCANEKDHKFAKEGKIPDKYIPQINWQMHCADAKKAYYASYHREETVILEVEYDQQYIQSIMPQIATFYRCMIELEEPSNSEDNQELKELCKKLRSLRASRDSIIDKIKTCEANILEILNENPDETEYMKVSRVEESTTIDYKAFFEENHTLLKDIDLDKYTKKRAGYWKITPREKDED